MDFIHKEVKLFWLIRGQASHLDFKIALKNNNTLQEYFWQVWRFGME